MRSGPIESLVAANDSADADQDFADLIEQVTLELEKNGSIDLDAITRIHPQYADRLQQVLPSMLALASWRRGEASSLAVRLSAGDPSEVSGGMSLGDFQIIREIGRGGMGVVYEAQQLSLHRLVALKVLPFAAVLDHRNLQRFKNEALAAATLDHPNIVSVYSVGEERGVYYYAMQLVRGQNLAEVISQLRVTRQDKSPLAETPTSQSPQAPRETPAKDVGNGASTIRWSNRQTPSTQGAVQALISTAVDSRHAAEPYRSAAWVGIQAAEALQHAHDLGVLHRDIKPGNLMLDADGKLYITDFGLARIEAVPSMTMTGNIIGTLRYMAPEQALAKRIVIDHRADIYSLGATLYELIALEPVFGETDRSELLKQIAFEEPRPLRKLDSRIPTDLDTIVLKAMEKNPDERYQTAQQLADDLNSYLESKPIKARPPTLFDRAGKWSRRHMALVWATASLLLLSTIGSALAGALIFQANQQTGAALAESHRSLDEAKRQQLAAQDGEHAARGLLYVADMRLARESLDEKHYRGAMDLVDRYVPASGESDFRRFEWHYLGRRIRSPHQEFHGSSMALRIAYSPDGSLLASPSSRSGEVDLWDATTGKVRKSFRGHRFRPTCVDFSPDGEVVASGAGFDDEPGEVKLWEVASGQEITSIEMGPVGIGAVAFSPDGKTLAVGVSSGIANKVEGGEIILWDVTARQVKTRLNRHTWGVCALAFSPDGKVLASSSFDGRVMLWNAPDASERKTLLTPPDSPNTSGNDAAYNIAFSPDGQLLALANKPGDHIGLWDWRTGKLVRALNSNGGGSLFDVAFVPGGQQIAATGQTGAVYCWDVETGNLTDELLAHEHWGFALAISPRDGAIASAGWKDGLKVWRLSAPSKLPQMPTSSSDDWTGFHRRIMSTDSGGETLAMVTTDQSIAIIDSKRGRETARITSKADSVEAIAMSPDGMTVAVVESHSEGGRDIRLFSTSSGEEIKVLAQHGQFADVTFSPDGARIAAADANRVTLWDYGTGADRTTTVTAYDATNVRCLAFSPNSRLLMTGDDAVEYTESVLRVWDVDSGKLQFAAIGPSQVNDAAFSPDSRQLVAGGVTKFAAHGSNGMLFVWDLQTGKRIASFPAHGQGAVTGVAYHPLENTLATCGSDDRMRLWDTDLWQERFEFKCKHGTPDNLLFAPAINSYLTTSLAGNTDRWSAASSSDVAHNEWEGWFHRGQALADAGEWEGAQTAITNAINRNPVSPRPWFLRGQIHAMTGNWDLAAADLSKALDQGNHSAELWNKLAIAELARNDEGAYRRICEQMVADVFPTSHCATIARATWTCALAPSAVKEIAALIPAADEAARIKPSQSYLLCQGAILYRAGRFDDAARVLLEAERGQKDLREDDLLADEFFSAASRSFFLAMAHHRLGNEDEAQDRLKMAAHQVAKEFREERERVGPELTWYRRVMYRRLQQEAESLIQVSN